MNRYILLLLFFGLPYLVVGQDDKVSLETLKKLLYVDKNTSAVIEALKKIVPSERTDLQEMATDFTWTLQNEKHYKLALDWAEYSTKIPFASKMFWMFQIDAKEKIRSQFSAYNKDNPNDCEVMTYMAEIYSAWSEIENEWGLVATIPDECEKKTILVKNLNKGLIFQPLKIKAKVLKNNSSLLEPDIRSQLVQEVKHYKRPSLQVQQSLWQDQFNQSLYSGFYSVELQNFSKGHQEVSISHRELSKLNLSTEEPTNIPHSIYGLSYKYDMLLGNQVLWGRAGLEYEKTGILLYSAELGTRFVVKKRFNSLQVGITPNYTAPSITQEIYKSELTYYTEGYHGESSLLSSLSVIGRYYSDKVFSVVSDVKMHYALRKGKQFDLLPFVEGFYASGSVERSSGFPYWILKQFYIAGGGLAMRYGHSGEKIYAHIDVAVFHASLASVLGRLTGTVEWAVSDMGKLNLAYEYYINQVYSANQVRAGFKYHL